MTSPVELVFVPAPGVGHISSAVEFAKLIIKRNARINIHIISFYSHSTNINTYMDSQSRDNPYPNRLSFTTFPPLSNPNLSIFTVVQNRKKKVKQVVKDRARAGLAKPVGLVLDIFCSKMVEIANELNIPSYLFFTSGANYLNFLFYAQSMVDDSNINIATVFNDPGFSVVVPGFQNRATSNVIPFMFQEEYACKTVVSAIRNVRRMKGILVNTYVELETFGINELLGSNDKRIPTVYPVGPILDLSNKTRGTSNSPETGLILRWLDGHCSSSVVFLCFGSMGTFNAEQVKEIAKGLENSGRPFLWALQKPSLGGAALDNNLFLEALPKGFIDRLRDRGMIIGWAPQVDILGHQAIGGFISHCGWNSILESIWFGIPVATWPIFAEQQLNAFQLVKELEVAVEIRIDYRKESKFGEGNVLVTAQEIVNGVNKLMGMDEKMMENIVILKDKAKKASEEGGSSHYYLGLFTENVLSNVS